MADWWTRPGVTTGAQFAAQARADGLYTLQVVGDIGGAGLPTVLVIVAGQQWLIHPSTSPPYGWVAGRAVTGADGNLDEVPADVRWLGPQDLPAAELLTNLIQPPSAAQAEYSRHTATR